MPDIPSSQSGGISNSAVNTGGGNVAGGNLDNHTTNTWLSTHFQNTWRTIPDANQILPPEKHGELVVILEDLKKEFAKGDAAEEGVKSSL